MLIVFTSLSGMIPNILTDKKRPKLSEYAKVGKSVLQKHVTINVANLMSCTEIKNRKERL